MLRLPRSLWITGLMALASALPAAANHPRLDQMRVVRGIADELEENARALASAARNEQYATGRVNNYALRGFETFLDRATHFHEQIEEYSDDPEHSADDYVALRQSFEVASRYFPTLSNTKWTAENKRCATEKMNALIAIYEAPVYVTPIPVPIHVDWFQIDGLAKAIARQADATDDAAKDDRSGRRWGRKEDRRRGLDSLEQLEDLADEYRRIVSRAQDRPDVTYDGMRRLAAAHNEAARWISVFDSRTRQRFSELGTLIAKLQSAYRNPRRPIGPAPAPWQRDRDGGEGSYSGRSQGGEPTTQRIETR